MNIVIDATAIVSVIIGEGNRRQILRAIRGSRLLVPPSSRWEVGNALSSMVKAGRTTTQRAVAAMQVYDRLGLVEGEVDMSAAIELAGSLRIYAFDAYVMQCARQHEALLLSQDERMLKNAVLLGIQTVEVRS